MGTQAGSAGTVCTFWDDTYASKTFIPNSITAPTTCTDSDPLWNYSIDRAPIAAVKDFLKVGIDPTTSQIWVKGMTGGTSPTADYTLTVTGRLPTGDSQTFDITITMTPCKSVLPVAPGFVDQVYYLPFPVGSYDAPAFTMDPACPQGFTYESAYTPGAWIDNNAGVGKLVQW